MSDRMIPINFNNLLNWIFTEYKNHRTIFGIPNEKFYFNDNNNVGLLEDTITNPIGPAAGPHTQLTQNIVSAYLTGGRFFELKTIQKMDELEVDKPCIDARDECYNVEWSQELKLDQSYVEYIKAWFILHLLKELFSKSDFDGRGFIFNMSVGYDLEGIKTERMNRFIDELIDASEAKEFKSCAKDLLTFMKDESIVNFLKDDLGIETERYNKILKSLSNISANISNSVTLSTMHGCPPNEIESISKYLMEEKGLHTFVKLNPTLLGYETVKTYLSNMGFNHIKLKEESFTHDLQYTDAVPMLTRLKEFANKHKIIFGVKLSNTLGVANNQNKLAGDDMYMSGRSLFSLTINLAYKLAKEFNGDLNISYSGGATEYNTNDILSTGIKPITYATDLLKPGGYQRLTQISSKITEANILSNKNDKIDLVKLKKLAGDSLTDKHYSRESRAIDTIKVPKKLGKYDCFISPCQEACPIHQDVSEYVRLVGENRFVEAFELIVSKNALPHITGHICDHQCMYHCTRWDYDEPVMIRELKKKAATEGYGSYVAKFKKEFEILHNDIKVAVIGAGPSGLSTAYFLAKSGFSVTVFENEMRPGGVVQNVLPDFRLPQEAIDKDIKFIEELGVQFVFGFDYNFSIDSLKTEGYKYIYVATGAGKSNEVNIEGNSENIFDAIEFLRDFKADQEIEPGKSVAVIGGGNSAMDSARAAMKRDTTKNVYIIYRRTKEFMPADKEEFNAALEDGVMFKDLLLPVKFDHGILTCQKMELGETGADGRRKVTPIENAYEEIEIDTVISAIGEKVDTDILEYNNIELVKGSIKVINSTNETSVENVFIGGDALRGPSTVVESIADGRKAADAIIARENQKPLQVVNADKFFDLAEREKDVITRKGVIVSHVEFNHSAEASRCLDCNFICTKCVEVCPNRANIAIDTSSLGELFKDKYQILHFDAACNECGNCETFCPHNGAPYKDKLTIFANETEFASSTNDGFYFIGNGSDDLVKTKVRIDSLRGELVIGADGKATDCSGEVSKETSEIDMLSLLIKKVHRNYKYLYNTAE